MSQADQSPRMSMDSRYRELHGKRETGERTAFQLDLAKRDKDHPEQLVGDFLYSVQEAGRFQPNEGERFHGGRKAGALDGARERFQSGKSKVPNTYLVAAGMIDHGIACEDLPEVIYVDREIKPGRITGATGETETLTDITTDLILATKLGQPVICEVKAKNDQNAYYALIQGLAACAQLSSGSQRERLAEHSEWAQKTLVAQGKGGRTPDEYVPVLAEGPMELWIVLVEHADHGEEKTALREIATELASKLTDNEEVAETVSRIRIVEADLEERPVLLRPRQP